MLTLLTTLISFLSAGAPKLLDFFQDRSDKKHELQLAQLQMEQQSKAQAAGFASQEHIEEIKTEQIQIQTQAEERQALYAHDIAIGQGASTWVINARAMVRPTVTYGLFFLLVGVDIAGIWYAWNMDVPFEKMMSLVWDDETQIIWASVISFWFGTQAFSKK